MHRFPGELVDGACVSVETEQDAPRSKPFDQGAGIATTAEGGVDERLPGGWLKAGYDVL
jgi:hypothetical protein